MTLSLARNKKKRKVGVGTKSQGSSLSQGKNTFFRTARPAQFLVLGKKKTEGKKTKENGKT